MRFPGRIICCAILHEGGSHGSMPTLAFDLGIDVVFLGLVSAGNGFFMTAVLAHIVNAKKLVL